MAPPLGEERLKNIPDLTRKQSLLLLLLLFFVLNANSFDCCWSSEVNAQVELSKQKSPTGVISTRSYSKK